MDRFDWNSYINSYKDLKESGINTKIKAWNHWINYGQKEGRKSNLNNINYLYKEFDWEKYIEKYIDLQQSGIKTKESAWTHWICHGQFENRNYFKYENNDVSIINLIGITDTTCSISDNLYMMKNYFEKTHRINIINYKEVNKIIIDNNEKYIFCLQPFEIKEIISFLKLFEEKYKPEVLWIWEFKSIPEIFKEQEKYFSKIYVQSDFCYKCFLNFFNISIEKIKLNPKIYNIIDKISNYNIQNQNIISLLEKTKNKIRFGYCFDLNSSIFRKNVLNLIIGFKNLIRDDIVLILKFRPIRKNNFVNQIEKDQYLKVMQLIDNNKIISINEELSDLELYKLYSNLDYYISPHVSEGYGLTIEENLILGVKIISTYYSGETEFLKYGNFVQIPHTEKEIYGLKEHPSYGKMSSFIGAYVSSEEITKTLQLVLNNDFNNILINNQVNEAQVNEAQVNEAQVNEAQVSEVQVSEVQVDTKIIKPERDIPFDVFDNNLFSDENYLIVKDPKHSNDCYHYTIWCKNKIINIIDLNSNEIENLKKFIYEIEKLNLYINEKKYFTYPPTRDRLHLHIVPKDYISYRPYNELYDFDEIDLIFKNIEFIKNINKQKENSIKLELRFNIGIIVLTNFNNLEKINLIKEIECINYIVIIRNKYEDIFVENLILNNKLINVHLISKNLNNYWELIKYDKLIFL